MKNIFFLLMTVVALSFACSGKNADGTPNVSTGDTSQVKSTADTTGDSTANAPADVN